MKNNLLIAISIAMLAILAITIVPTFAFVIAPNPSGENGNFELYGPHVAGILIKIYASTTAEWTGMNAGEIDFEDWALDKSWADLWATPGGPVTIANYGGEAGYMELDINNNWTFTASDSTPGTDNPTRDLYLRQALAFCVNRSWIITNLLEGLGNPMYTMVPTYMSGYVNHDISPGGLLEAYTYGGYQGDVVTAAAVLTAHNFPIGPDGWRYWDKNGNSVKDAGEDLVLIFWSRNGQRGVFGDWYNAVITAAPIKIHTTYHSSVPRAQVTGPVFAQEDYQLYTGGWTGIGPDPDFLCDLYNGSNYYHPGSPPNYLGMNYPNVNGNLTNIKLAASLPAGTAATLMAQRAMAEVEGVVPLWCASGVKAYRNVPVEGGGNWTDMVNQKGIGVNSWWSTLSMYKQGDFYPNFTYYGFSSTITLMNIVYAQWFWDMEVLGRIYDGGAGRDPMTLASWNPQLYKGWTVGTWTDPATHETKTSVTITLRPDVMWQDGHPFTVADVYYTLVEISKDILAKGLPPPWWYPTVQYMRSVEILDDYNIQILLDVYSVWAVGWVIGSVIIPAHIWKPIVDASSIANPVVQQRQPDPNVIGTGPFRFYSELVDQNIVMVANKPGSIVNGVTSPGYYQYCPIRVDVTPDNAMHKINLSPTAPGVTSNVSVTINNLSTDKTIVVNKYCWINGVIMPGFPHDVTLTPGSTETEVLPIPLLKKTKNTFEVDIHVKTGDSAWVSQWINVSIPIWVTQKMDISGTTLYDVLGYGSYPTWLKSMAPAPDLKVDGKDIALAAKSFGTVPGDSRWSAVCDVNLDYKVDGKDIALIAKQFGW